MSAVAEHAFVPETPDLHPRGRLDRRLAPRGAIVVVQARHLCMEMRGVLKPGTTTTTRATRGGFEDERLRQEFLDLVERSA